MARSCGGHSTRQAKSALHMVSAWTRTQFGATPGFGQPAIDRPWYLSRTACLGRSLSRPLMSLRPGALQLLELLLGLVQKPRRALRARAIELARQLRDPQLLMGNQGLIIGGLGSGHRQLRFLNVRVSKHRLIKRCPYCPTRRMAAVDHLHDISPTGLMCRGVLHGCFSIRGKWRQAMVLGSVHTARVGLQAKSRLGVASGT
jgi:hypothetical protein